VRDHESLQSLKQKKKGYQLKGERKRSALPWSTLSLEKVRGVREELPLVGSQGAMPSRKIVNQFLEKEVHTASQPFDFTRKLAFSSSKKGRKTKNSCAARQSGVQGTPADFKKIPFWARWLAVREFQLFQKRKVCRQEGAFLYREGGGKSMLRSQETKFGSDPVLRKTEQK